jgi:hypothetical protein
MKKMTVLRLVTFCMAALLLFCGSTAYGDVTLPEGAVAGLPENITVLDSDGNSVNTENGEYFFEVSDMMPYETYTKDIQLMNLREDAAYHIYFYVEPIAQEGDIDLRADCTAVMTLNGEQIYEGLVTGEGTPDLTNGYIDLGAYAPGEGGKLTCSVTWDGASADQFIDHGTKLTDASGTRVVREGNAESGTIYGKVTFKWIFYAVVQEQGASTGLLGSGENMIYMGLLLLALVAVLVMAVLVRTKKRQRVQGDGAAES